MYYVCYLYLLDFVILFIDSETNKIVSWNAIIYMEVTFLTEVGPCRLSSSAPESSIVYLGLLPVLACICYNLLIVKIFTLIVLFSKHTHI